MVNHWLKVQFFFIRLHLQLLLKQEIGERAEACIKDVLGTILMPLGHVPAKKMLIQEIKDMKHLVK